MSDAAAPDPRNKGRWVLIWELGRDDYRLRGVFSGTEAATSGRRAPWMLVVAADAVSLPVTVGCGGSVKTPGGGFWSHVRQCSLAAVVDSLAFLAAAAAPSDGGESQGPNPHRAGGDEPWNAW
ncbi:hypothetical protein PG999_004237 [Apiospora kogelbergensis]|uniref:Immunity protein 53 n=1 Tax=Apiospora kogelbergensis TaxID=1337665 RepID=A0AAW0QYN6_9PEZI